MNTTKTVLRRWFERGVEQKSTHMIIACDTFDHEDYPIYVSDNEDVRTKVINCDGSNMQRVMEVYNLNMDMEEQMSERRVFNY